MSNLEIYKKAVFILGAVENIALITIISTIGSTPGKTGYKMLICGGSGEAIGTVGGGLSEAEIITVAKKILPAIDSKVIRFNFNDKTNWNYPRNS